MTLIKRIALSQVDLNEAINNFVELTLERNLSRGYRIKILKNDDLMHDLVFDDLLKARVDLEKRRKHYLQEGYNEVEISIKTDGDKTESKPYQLEFNTKRAEESQVDTGVLRLIHQLFVDNMVFVEKSIHTPLGKVTQHQITLATKQLDLAELLIAHHESKESMVQLSNQFYLTMPVKFDRNLPIEHYILDSSDKIDAMRELLDTTSTIVGSPQIQHIKNLEAKYHQLGIEMVTCGNHEAEFQQIQQMLRDGNHHHMQFTVTNIFRINNMDNFVRYNPQNLSTLDLVHGTRTENILSILETGLKLRPPTGTFLTGRMFGAGLYFAKESESSKSMNYSNGFALAYSNKYYLFLAEVAVGKIYETEMPRPDLYDAPNGYDSVQGVPGYWLRYNEHVVYHNDQVKLRYLVEFEIK
ncbi:MAG: hypothetical protein LBT37_00540 [Lactobacillaceae bacterium]|jgi:poly [ADP-ribose] polymerase|nr:hypothetical protein [Lactobacillaceae bacterium]